MGRSLQQRSRIIGLHDQLRPLERESDEIYLTHDHTDPGDSDCLGDHTDAFTDADTHTHTDHDGRRNTLRQ